MSFKYALIYAGCAVSWCVLLPLLVLGGGLGLLTYAIVAELAELVGWHTMKSPQGSAARELARRVCLGH